MTKYRIVEQWGEVHIQYSAFRLLWWTWWRTITGIPMLFKARAPVDYGSVEYAKTKIDQWRAEERAAEAARTRLKAPPTKIIPY